jgi:hypothetical protein
MDSESFVVRDAKTGEDLTRSILLQIILEQEANGSPMFTKPVLSTSSGSTATPCRVSWAATSRRTCRPGGHAGQAGRAVQERDAGNVDAVHEHAGPMMQGTDGQHLEQSKNLFADAGADAEADRTDAGQLRHEALKPCAIRARQYGMMKCQILSPRPPKVGFVSLGCPKALTDSELILTQLSAEGYQTSKTLRALTW